MTVANLFSKPCVVTDCILKTSCAKQPLVPPPLKDTAVIVNEYPTNDTSILDTITGNTAPLRGTPLALKCGGSAFILEDRGHQQLRPGIKTSTLARCATTIGPYREDGITTETLLLAGHHIAPIGNNAFTLEAVTPESAIPIAALDDVPPVGKSERSNPWVLQGTEWQIAQALMRLTPTLPALTRGITEALTPALTADAALSVFVSTGARAPQTVTVDLQSTQREDGFWTGDYWVENPFARIDLVRMLRSMGFRRV